MTVLYKVNLIVSNEVIDQYLIWLENHIKEMLQFNGFQDASFEIVSKDNEMTTILAVYKVASRKDLEDYFENHAERMRGDGLKHFGGKFTASREIEELE